MAKREYQDIILYKEKEFKNMREENLSLPTVSLIIPGTNDLPAYHKIVETKVMDYPFGEDVPKNGCTKWFDYDKIENAVEVRTRKEGDYLQVHRLGGRKKLKDFFIDQKIPKEERAKRLLFADGSHIMWIPEVENRMSEKYKIDETTKHILIVKLIDVEENESA